ncbi:MAG: mevalonate kinase, partial [bacterium]
LRGRLQVPGNLLIAGEYSVLEDGGLGVAMAVGPPVLGRIISADSFRLVARAGSYTSEWRPDTQPAHGIDYRVAVFAHALSILENESSVRSAFTESECDLSEQMLEVSRTVRNRDFEPVEITVDTRSLFTSDGRKMGFGSSAAATVTGMACILAAAGYDPTADRRVIHRLATAAHRSLQGKAGSGYDVAASVFGGMGLFTGGSYPRYERIMLPWFPQPAIDQGAAPQSTVNAVMLYKQFKEHHPKTVQKLFDRNQTLVRGLASSIHGTEGFRFLGELRDHGEEIGELIGVPASLEIRDFEHERDTGCASRFHKALGAGRETIMILPHLAGCPGHAIIRDDGGLRWA